MAKLKPVNPVQGASGVSNKPKSLRKQVQSKKKRPKKKKR